MPLYTNVILSGGKSADDNRSQRAPSASMKLLHDHLKSKRRSKPQTAPRKTQIDRSTSSGDVVVSESHLHSSIPGGDNDWSLEDEYDPMVPNSYELLKAEYIKTREVRLASRHSRAANESQVSNLLDALDRLEDLDNDDNHEDYGERDKRTTQKKPEARGTAIAPPPSLMSSAQQPSEHEETSEISSTTATASRKSSTCAKSSVAAKIMSKMGYKLGQGLGKDEQGMSAPLEVEKSGVNVGRITMVAKEETSPSRRQMAELLRESTRLILLQNMVGPGEVDEELENETKEECSKYGEVARCLIYEIPNRRVPDEEAVRIFVEFRQVESAIRAVGDLNGRYFGGRVVRATFYDLGQFGRYELEAPVRAEDQSSDKRPT